MVFKVLIVCAFAVCFTIAVRVLVDSLLGGPLRLRRKRAEPSAEKVLADILQGQVDAQERLLTEEIREYCRSGAVKELVFCPRDYLIVRRSFPDEWDALQRHEDWESAYAMRLNLTCQSYSLAPCLHVNPRKRYLAVEGVPIRAT